ncbi:MAG UNVERIFIED_CONTAM: hypothetical protein LVR18_07980 [Planctomycetaceae bacterium]
MRGFLAGFIDTAADMFLDAGCRLKGTICSDRIRDDVAAAIVGDEQCGAGAVDVAVTGSTSG